MSNYNKQSLLAMLCLVARLHAAAYLHNALAGLTGLAHLPATFCSLNDAVVCLRKSFLIVNQFNVKTLIIT